jgi:hypothetical protein
MANYEIIDGSRRPTMILRAAAGVEMLDPSVHAVLAAILPPPALLTASEDTKPYECDGLMLYREQPAAVLLPENEAQVIAILRCCFAAGIAVVARGAGTSLSGTLARCAEFGRMHVHRGELRHPELPRF